MLKADRDLSGFSKAPSRPMQEWIFLSWHHLFCSELLRQAMDTLQHTTNNFGGIILDPLALPDDVDDFAAIVTVEAKRLTVLGIITDLLQGLSVGGKISKIRPFCTAQTIRQSGMIMHRPFLCTGLWRAGQDVVDAHLQINGGGDLIQINPGAM